MRTEQVDRFLDLMEAFKEIAQAATGAYMQKVNYDINNNMPTNDREVTGGHYTQSTGQPFGCISRKRR